MILALLVIILLVSLAGAASSIGAWLVFVDLEREVIALRQAQAPAPAVVEPAPHHDGIALILCDALGREKHQRVIHDGEPPRDLSYGGVTYIQDHVNADGAVVYHQAKA